MTNNISDHYDKIYSENKAAFGTEPVPLVVKILDYIKSGKTIEFGAGEGRNSLFLASKGFQVTAIDISPIAIKKIGERATVEKIILKTEIANMTQFEFSDDYDLIISTFTLHHIARGKAIEFVQKIKQHTKFGGFNLITSFTKNGDFYKLNPNTNKFYLSENELKNLYQDWDVMNYFEKGSKALAKNPDGTAMSNVFAGIIAKKNSTGSVA